jgi:hypothetical protein
MGNRIGTTEQPFKNVNDLIRFLEIHKHKQLTLCSDEVEAVEVHAYTSRVDDKGALCLHLNFITKQPQQ